MHRFLVVDSYFLPRRQAKDPKVSVHAQVEHREKVTYFGPYLLPRLLTLGYAVLKGHSDGGTPFPRRQAQVPSHTLISPRDIADIKPRDFALSVMAGHLDPADAIVPFGFQATVNVWIIKVNKYNWLSRLLSFIVG